MNVYLTYFQLPSDSNCVCADWWETENAAFWQQRSHKVQSDKTPRRRVRRRWQTRLKQTIWCVSGAPPPTPLKKRKMKDIEKKPCFISVRLHNSSFLFNFIFAHYFFTNRHFWTSCINVNRHGLVSLPVIAGLSLICVVEQSVENSSHEWNGTWFDLTLELVWID